MSHISSLLLRAAFFALFIWFGIQQILSPEAWMGFLPEWTGYLPVPGEMMVGWNGWLEIVFGTSLMIGLFTRFCSTVLGLHLIGIALTAGGAVAARDFALAAACFSLVLAPADQWTLDQWLFKSNPQVSKIS